MAKAKNTNFMNTVQLDERLEALIKERQTWEQGSYKLSNEELYQILGKCAELYEQIKAQPSLNTYIKDCLEAKGFKTQTNTSLELRLVRHVFGEIGKREYAYAKTVVALQKKLSNQSAYDFIHEKGGVENIRRTVTGQSPSEKRRDKIEQQKRRMSRIKPIAQIPSDKAAAIEFSDVLETKLAAAVLRENAAGDIELVYSTTNIAALENVLARVAAAKALEAEQEEAADQARDDVARRQQAINETLK